MSAELSDWLAELGESQQATAAEVGAALVALLDRAEPADLAWVGQPRQPDPRQAVDYGYQQILADLQVVRHGVAAAVSARKAAELRVSARRAGGAGPGELGLLEADLAAAGQRQEQLSRQSERLQHQADAFRAAKETAKATYTAAEAQLRVAEALADVAEIDDAAAVSDSAELREAVGAAEARLRKLAGQPEAASAPAPGLLELRADPFGTDIRILFAVEPADTVTLLAVLEGPEAVGQHGDEAVGLAGALLTGIREQGWPADVDAVVLPDPRAFLARYGSVARRAALLAGTVPLARLREDRGLTVSEVAARSGLPADRILAIEEHGLRVARIHEAVALARALGARLDLPSGSGVQLG